MNWNAFTALNSSLILNKLQNLPDALEEKAWEREAVDDYLKHTQELKKEIYAYQKEYQEGIATQIAKDIREASSKNSIENIVTLGSYIVGETPEEQRAFAAVAAWAGFCLAGGEDGLTSGHLIALLTNSLCQECYKKPCDDTGVISERTEAMAKHEALTVKMNEALEDTETVYPLDLLGDSFLVFNSRKSLKMCMFIWHLFSPGMRLDSKDDRL